jgi:rieske iron-sulfur protein
MRTNKVAQEEAERMAPATYQARVADTAGDTMSTSCGSEGTARRAVLCGCAAAAVVGFSWPSRADDADDPARMARPQKGDLLVYFDGDHEGQVIRPAELKVGNPSFMAWAYDPQKKVPRDGSRLNMVLIVRLDPATIASSEKSRAADGIVAYSAICTHQQCPVAEWLDETKDFRCPCHQSTYDPRNGAQVVSGPAPRPLPALPLAITGDQLQVAGPFTSRVGGEKAGVG